MPFNIAFVLFPDFEELDFVGPFEVLAAYAKNAAPDWRVFSVGGGDAVRSANGLTVQADHRLDEAPAADVIVVPGGFGTRAAADDTALIEYLRGAGASARYVTSVCTGTFLLHRAGFLAGKRATTHWGSLDRLRALGDVEVVEERWVQDGNVITAAGVSAGIDMALYLLGLLTSPAVARTVQKYIEYDPAPPYADVAPIDVAAS